MWTRPEDQRSCLTARFNGPGLALLAPAAERPRWLMRSPDAEETPSSATDRAPRVQVGRWGRLRIAGRARPIRELERLDVAAVVHDDTGADDVVESSVRGSIREVFDANSLEFNEHEHLRLRRPPTVSVGQQSRKLNGAAGARQLESPSNLRAPS